MKFVHKQRGSLAVEVVLVVPVLMIMVMFIVFVGRVQSASMTVRHAADVGARSGSIAHTIDAQRRAYIRSAEELSRAQHVCESFRVHTELRNINGEMMVAAMTQCIVRASGLSFLGISGPTVRATSMEVIDHFRSSQ